MAKILIVDDDHAALDLLELFLYSDYEVVTALNGFDGMTKAEKEKPDLIITDITMPVMDGIRFFNLAIKNEAVKRVPIIAVTSFAEGITAKSLINMGFSGVIPKPLERGLILTVIADTLRAAAEKGSS
ncbi:MAG: response regulator [Chitinispirillales bacterium]|jgi:CheY-like chemotaxis protein|nr:response regulator [Chitinispirillales bacterium]